MFCVSVRELDREQDFTDSAELLVYLGYLHPSTQVFVQSVKVFCFFFVEKVLPQLHVVLIFYNLQLLLL